MSVIEWLLEGDPAIRWQVPDGRWLLGRIHPGRVYFDLKAGAGTPSRWNTLRVLRVLNWWDGIA